MGYIALFYFMLNVKYLKCKHVQNIQLAYCIYSGYAKFVAELSKAFDYFFFKEWRFCNSLHILNLSVLPLSRQLYLIIVYNS